MQDVETVWRMLGDEARVTEQGLAVILQIWRFGGHFCGAHGASLPLHPYSCRPGQNKVRGFGFFYLKSYAFWFIIKQSLKLRICLFYTFHSKCICQQKSIEKMLNNCA